MTSDCMDCRATLAVTKSLFKVRVRYRAGFGKLEISQFPAPLVPIGAIYGAMRKVLAITRMLSRLSHSWAP
jgi:hypothetical protein